MKWIIENGNSTTAHDGIVVYPSENPRILGMRVGFMEQSVCDTFEQAIEKAFSLIPKSPNKCSLNIYKSEREHKEARRVSLALHSVCNDHQDEFTSTIEALTREENSYSN